jgi:pimeloyl-ACP methyl ester carboxylesterase
MPGLGHFPMAEDPQAFLAHLRPVLAELAGADAGRV